MTQQIEDVAYYREKRFTPCPLGDEARLFDPQLYGMQLSAPTTACRRGFQARYEIVSDILYLAHLGVHVTDSEGQPLKGPLLGGVEPRCRWDSVLDDSLFDWFSNYYDLRYPIPFSGQLLLGDTGAAWFSLIGICGAAFEREYEDVIGPSWFYQHETLYRLTFDEGRLTEEEDLSELNRQYREMVEAVYEKTMQEERLKRELEQPWDDEEPPF